MTNKNERDELLKKVAQIFAENVGLANKYVEEYANELDLYSFDHYETMDELVYWCEPYSYAEIIEQAQKGLFSDEGSNRFNENRKYIYVERTCCDGLIRIISTDTKDYRPMLEVESNICIIADAMSETCADAETEEEAKLIFALSLLKEED